jgi:LPS-assembly protein
MIRIAVIAVCAMLALPVFAQEGDRQPALLVADQVFVTPERQLIAEGNVSAIQGQTRLRAERITYDRATGSLLIEGPIRIDEGDGITILADQAELDDGLRNGLLIGARLVLERRLQLASLQMTRVGGRYSQLYKTAVTSCRVCDDGRPPLWQIRARKIIHDQEEKQLYFENAQFRVLDLPIFYLPALRLPDPTLKRATGFLIPSTRTTSNLGTGIKIPYFIRLGDHADLTLTPYISSRTRTLEYRYRQAFRNGSVIFEGAHTRDELITGSNRGYVFGTGLFDLSNDFKLRIDVQYASDNAYLVDYGLPDLDRLRSQIAITRYRPDNAIRARLIHFKSLRDADNDDELPSLVSDVGAEYRIFPAALGGELRLGAQAHSHIRTSSADMLGRDIWRASASAYWIRNWSVGGGLRAQSKVGMAFDSTRIEADSTFANRVTTTTPSASLALRYPLVRHMPNGASHLLEPVAQLAWSDVSGGTVPNDESRFVEFDQGNLLALSRFPADDRREDGAAFAYGISWTRTAPSGWQASLSMGQVIRQTADPDFTATSGLSGVSSNLLLAGQLKLDKGVSVIARTLFDDAASFSKAELRGMWKAKRGTLEGTYTWLGADAVEGRDRALSEIWLDGSYEVSDGWTAKANIRYDISDARATRAGLGFVYANECVTVDLNVNRRYTSSSSIEPTTDFGFTISLNGFSVNPATDRYAYSCK